MALETNHVEVILEGLSQKTDRKVTTPGKLRTAENVEFDKSGSLNKRRGFTRVDLSDTLDGSTPEIVFLTVATMRDELVIYGTMHLYSVADRDSRIGSGDDQAVVVRGRVLRGGYSIQHVVSGSLGAVNT